MRVITLCAVALLAGCSNKHITPDYFHTAEALCANNDGLWRMRVTKTLFTPRTLYAYCNNGAEFRQKAAA